MKLAIVGGGAAGLMAAATACKNGVEIDLYEKNDKIGKKILVSGNGHCNINIDITGNEYFGDNAPYFVDYALKQFGFNKFEKFFGNMLIKINFLLTK